jgi:hypothetical protein
MGHGLSLLPSGLLAVVVAKSLAGWARKVKCDTSALTFAFGPSAGLYSTLASVLAGFAFLAITLVIGGTHRRAGSEPATDAEHARHHRTDIGLLVTLTIAFVSFILASVQYGEIAGETGCAITQGRSASEEFLAGVTFIFSVLLLFYAIVQMISDSGIPNLGHSIRGLVAVIAPPVAMLLLAAAAEEVAYTPWINGRANTSGLSGFIENARVNPGLSVLLLLLSILIWRVPVTFPRFGARIQGGIESRGMQRFFPYISLLAAILAVLRENTFSELRPNDGLGDVELVLWLVLCSVGLLAQSALLSFQRMGLDPDHQRRPSRSEPP